VVQEGVIPAGGGSAVPKLYKFDIATGDVTFLFDLTDIDDAAGVAVEPGDPNHVWVLSQASGKIVKYNLILQRSGYAGNPAAPTGNCELLGKVLPELSNDTSSAVARPTLILLGLAVTTALMARRRQLASA